MLLLATYQLSRNITPSKLAKASTELLQSGKFPIEGVEIIQWLVCPGGSGIMIYKADDEIAAAKGFMVWAEALPGFFERYEVMPAIEAQDIIAMALE